MMREVHYDEIKDLCNQPEKLLIDVRNPSEVKEGSIPTSINIPLGELQTELSLDAADFKQKYGREKPKADTYLIIYCRCGRRSQIAMGDINKLGFTNYHIYAGGFLDYEKLQKRDQNKT